MTTTLTSPLYRPSLSTRTSLSPHSTAPSTTRPLRSSPLVSPPANEKTRTGATPSRISYTPSFTPPSDVANTSVVSTDSRRPRAVTSTLPRPTSESFAFQMELRPPPRVASVIGLGGGCVAGGRDEIGLGPGIGVGVGFGMGPAPRGAFTAPGIYAPPTSSAASTSSTPAKGIRRPRTAPERDSFSAPGVFTPAIRPASGSDSDSATLPVLSVADADARAHFPFARGDDATQAHAQIPAAMISGGRQRAVSAVLPRPSLSSSSAFTPPPAPPMSAASPSPSTSSDPNRNWLSATNTGPPPFSRTRLGGNVVMPVKKGNGSDQGAKKVKQKRPKTAPENNNKKERAMGIETKLRTIHDEERSASVDAIPRRRRKSILAVGELGELREEEEQQSGDEYDELHRELARHFLVPDTDGSIRSASTDASLLSPSATLVSTPVSTPPLSRDSSSNAISTGGESVKTLLSYATTTTGDLKQLEPVYAREKHQPPGPGDIFAAEKMIQLELLQGKQRGLGSDPLKAKAGVYSHAHSPHSASAILTGRRNIGDKCADPYTENRRTNTSKWKAFLKMVGVKLTRRKGQAAQ